MWRRAKNSADAGSGDSRHGAKTAEPMSDEDRLRRLRNNRIRRVKRFLRPLPRRATIHRYPVLRWFAEMAKRRSYLWSFRVKAVVPALYAGCILTLLPLYGIQLVLGFFVAVAVRGNLPILIGLQFFSNPFTVLPLWFADYQVGRAVLAIFGVSARPLRQGEVKSLIKPLFTGDVAGEWGAILLVLGVVSLGAVVMGAFFGLVCGVLYKVLADRSAKSYQALVAKIHARHAARSEDS